MTVATEAAAAKPPSAWQRLAPYAAPALILLSIVVPFLRYHEYSLLAPESLLLMGGATLAGAAVGGVSRLRPNTLGPILIVVLLGVFVVYRKELYRPLVRATVELGEAIGHFGIAFGLIAVALILGTFFLCWLLRQHLATFVVLVFGTIVSSSVVLPTTTGGEAVTSGALPAKLNDLPLMIHIVLDEHIGLAAIPPEIPESSAATTAITATYEDFAVYSRAYSRFAETQNALGSLMNYEAGEDVLSLLERQNYGYTLRESAWFDLLRAKGYAIKVYQTPWLEMCSEVESVDACYTYPLHSPNAAQRSTLPTGARLRVLLGYLGLWRATPLPSSIAAIEALDRFQADLAQAPRGVAYFVHVMLPHYDYMYDSVCSLADPADWQTQPGHDDDAIATSMERRAAYRLYLGQLICTERYVARLLEQLKRLGVYEDATIIVHGDHGSRIAERTGHAPAETMTYRDLLDHFSTLLAIKTPGAEPGIQEDPVSLQQVFREKFLEEGHGETLPPGLVLIRNEATETFAPRTLVWPDRTDGSLHDALAARHSFDLRGTE
jgi:hypothetical protein